ncbi:MAG TPA: hypothetical protein VFQ43_02880, partial [Nitrososphaera sp.]|nr:hypothetical protein [Nitrososphaera sp.]
MEGQGYWNKDNIADRIALFLYLPLIQREFMGFVRMWNAHRIRLQKAGHIIAGKPYLLYFQPDPETARDCRLSLDRDRLRTLQNISDQDPSQLDDFLPEET